MFENEVKIICHESSPVFVQHERKWELRESDGCYGANIRHCNYCGSIHPEDLLKVLSEGAILEQADWKYGWPHKFYVSHIKNPKAGEIVQIGSSSKGGISTPIMGKASEFITLKFYNNHLNDLIDTSEFDIVAEAIRLRTGIKFSIKEGKLYYQTCQWN